MGSNWLLGNQMRRVCVSGLVLLCLSSVWGCGSSKQTPADGVGGVASGGAPSGSGGASPQGGTNNDLGVTGISDAGAGNACERNVSLTAVTISEAAPFDLIIVADHSQSLAWSRSELSSGLHDLLTNVQGRAVRIFLLTPTQYGASSAAAKGPLTGDSIVAWQDPMTGKAYENAMANYEQTCTNPAGAAIACPSPLGPTPYKAQGVWRFAPPSPIAVIRPDMTAAEFAAQQMAVTNSILAIGGNGSPHEQPLCTLSRYISQDPKLLPSNAVFLVISDEDDTSTPSDCLGGFTGELKVTQNESGTTACTSNCDAYRYEMVGQSYTTGFTFSCRAFDDLGRPIAGSDQPGFASQGSRPSCAGITAGACNDDESRMIGGFCEAGRTLISCARECTPSLARCTVDLHDPALNPCTQGFTSDGASYNNLAAYCAKQGTGWQNCTGGGVDIQYSTSTSGTTQPMGLMPGSKTADIASYFRARANTVFKPNAYLVEAIAFDPAFSCNLGVGQTYATNLTQFVGDRSHVFPLCKSYAPALDGVLTFAQTLVQSDFPVRLADDEQVTEVHIISKDGSERVLTSTEYKHDATTQVLSVERSALKSTDVNLRVEVTSACRPLK